MFLIIKINIRGVNVKLISRFVFVRYESVSHVCQPAPSRYFALCRIKHYFVFYQSKYHHASFQISREIVLQGGYENLTRIL